MPVGGYIQVNGEEQTSLVEMLSEVVISTELSKLRDNDTNGTDGFVQVKKHKIESIIDNPTFVEYCLGQAMSISSWRVSRSFVGFVG